MKRLIFVIVVLLMTVPSYAYELLMFSNKQCPYCDNFLKEVKPGYGTTPYAEKLPLRVIETSGNPPKWFEDAFNANNIDAIEITPTFVIWDNDHQYEIARLLGYINKERFYQDLDKFIDAMGQIELPSLHPEGSRHK
jgi:thioredoxin-related protein|tara:strand:+ start:1899 stop:2309 length:411 start_codon:yes stop_codon:yes gene_type:complete